MNRFRNAALCTAGLAALFCLPATAPAAFAADDVTINIAAITDFHGHIEMAPNMGAQLNDIRNQNPNTFFVSTGDSVGGSAYVSSIAEDEPTMKILSAMKLQTSGLGNHEFDRGYADILNRQLSLYSSDFNYVNSNIDFSNSPVYNSNARIRPYQVMKTQDGSVSIGFIGAITADLANLVNRDGIAGLTVSDPVANLNQTAAQLKDGDASNGEADVVVALLHDDYTFAQQLSADIDAAVAGHTHTNQTVATASGAPVIQPDSFGRLLGNIELTVDKTSKTVTESKTEMRTIINTAKDPSAAKDSEIQAMVDEATATAKELGAAPVGTITGTAKRGTQGDDEQTENRGAESTLGNLLAEGFVQYAKMQGVKADFGIMNAGGLRAPSLDANGDGTVSVEESYNVQPFNGEIGTIELTPSQVYALVEQQWKPEGASRPMLKLGFSRSFSYTYNPEAEIGHKVIGVYLNGEQLDRNETTTTLRVAGGTFLLNGGDGYTVMSEGINLQKFPGINDLGAFNAFLAANPGYRVDQEQGSIGVLGPQEVKAGQTVTYEFSSLSWTTDEPNAESLDVYFDDELVATVTIDNTVVASLDETGRAGVTFTVPASAKSGVSAINLRFGDTDFNVPVTVIGNPSADKPTKLPNTGC